MNHCIPVPNPDASSWTCNPSVPDFISFIMLPFNVRNTLALGLGRNAPKSHKSALSSTSPPTSTSTPISSVILGHSMTLFSPTDPSSV